MKPVFNPKSREKHVKGINYVVDSVAPTIGPNGKNGMVRVNGSPTIANDAWTLVQPIKLKDDIEDMAAQSVKGVIQKTSELVGGGRTASALLFKALFTEGNKYDQLGMNMNLVRKGMKLGSEDIIKELQNMARLVKSKKELVQIATISTESAELGELIADTVWKVGKDGKVNVEDSQAIGLSVTHKEGLEIDKGYVSRSMTTNDDATEAIFDDVDILITDKKINSLKDIKDLIQTQVGTLPSGQPQIALKRENLVIIAEEFDEAFINFTILARMNGLKILCIKIPGFGEQKKDWLDDLCALTGATIGLAEENIGKAKKIVSHENTTQVFGGNVDTYCEHLQARISDDTPEYARDNIRTRIARLQNGIAVIKIGAASDRDLKYLKLKIQDGISESKRALEEGIIPGGNVSFINAVKKLPLKKGHDEVSLGYNLVLKAVEQPLRQIILNGNGEAEVIINAIKQSDSDIIGYDALKGEISDDMFKSGIVDAVKVARVALQNAVDEAAIFLTIELSVADYN